MRIPGEEEQVPEVALSDELKGDNSHWCCAGITPITTTVLTQLSSQTQLYAEPIKVWILIDDKNKFSSTFYF